MSSVNILKQDWLMVVTTNPIFDYEVVVEIQRMSIKRLQRYWGERYQYGSGW